MPEPRTRVAERAKGCCEYCHCQHKWAEHFAWSDDGALILGLTPIGRAVVEKLQLNRTGLVSLRRAYYLKPGNIRLSYKRDQGDEGGRGKTIKVSAN